MKKFFGFIMLVMAFVLVIVSSASASEPTTPTINGQLTETQLKRMAEVQKRSVNQLVFYFYSVGTDGNPTGNPKYIFNVSVINGIYDAKMQGIEVGNYSVNVYAMVNSGIYAFKDEQIPLQVIANQTSTLSVNLKLADYTLIPIKIQVVGASFDEGASYQISLPYDQQGFSQAEFNAVYSQGYLSFNLWAYQPYSTDGQVAISITDKLGNVYNNTYSINIMDTVNNNWQPVTLTSPSSGNVTADIKFSHERISLLKTRLVPLTNNDLKNGVNTLYRVKMTAGTGIDIGIMKQTFMFYKSEGIEVWEIVITDESTGTILLNVPLAPTENVFYFEPTIIIPAGLSKTFVVKATITGVVSGSYIVTQMIGQKYVNYQDGVATDEVLSLNSVTLTSPF